MMGMMSGGEEEDPPMNPDEMSGNPLEVQPPQQAGGGGQSGGQGQGGGFSPEQEEEQNGVFQTLEGQFPELPVFLSQNPQFFEGAHNFLASAQRRYSGNGGAFSG